MTEFYLDIENGEVKNPYVLKKNLEPLTKGRYRVIVEKGSKRSDPQNRFYHAVCCQIVFECLRDAGYNEIKSPGDAHEVLKYKFLRKQIPNENGEYVEIIGSTAKLTKGEFMAYLEDIARWVTETWGIVIPAPGSQSEMYFQ